MILYRLLRPLFSLYLRLVHRLAIRGEERIPSAGPVILCANHTSYLDAMLLGLCTRRQVRFMVLRNFYDHPLLGFFIRHGGGIPVNVTGADTEAFKAALSALNQGEVIGIFPEGRLSRTGLPSPGRPGAALLAASAEAPLVPVTITGAFFVYRKGSRLPRPGAIQVTIHPPVRVERDRKRDRNYLAKVTDQVMTRIGKRVRGYYRLRGKRRRAGAGRVMKFYRRMGRGTLPLRNGETT